MVWQCVASSCNIFILTIRTTAVAQLQGHFKELLMTDSSAVGKKNKKKPLSTNSSGEQHQHFTNQHTSAAAVPSWCVAVLPSLLWPDVLKVPNKGAEITMSPMRAPQCLDLLPPRGPQTQHMSHQQRHWTCMACLVWGQCLSVTTSLLSDTPKGHLHVFAGHVVVVLKDRRDALFLLGELRTVRASTYNASMSHYLMSQHGRVCLQTGGNMTVAHSLIYPDAASG